MPPKYAEDIVQLFQARPKLRFIEPDPMPAPQKFSSIAQLLPMINKIDIDKSKITESPLSSSKIEKRKQRIEANNQRIEIQKQKYHPKDNPNATSNPYNTIFIWGLTDDVTEEAVRYELGVFGQIKSVKFVYDHENHRKPYCFVEYEREESFRNAMKQGTKLYFNQKKMIVDCERARTVDGWLPRRLGGGMGGMSRRFTKKAFIIRQENVTKRKKSQQIKYGIRYRGAIAEVSKKREQKIGLQKFISQKRKESRYHRRNFP